LRAIQRISKLLKGSERAERLNRLRLVHGDLA
jgi:hypothetical protein